MAVMAPFGSTISPSTSSFFFSQTQKRPFQSLIPRKPNLKISAKASFLPGTADSTVEAVSEVSSAGTTSFGFKNLTETFWVDVQRAEEMPLKVKLGDPSSRLENVAIRVELSNGCVGWGEVAAAAATAAAALAKAKEACEFLRRSSALTLNLVLEEIGTILHGQEYASIRAGVEMALIDAVANSIDVPLWRLFGGVSNSLTTSVTIPIASPAEASELASKYCGKGFNIIRFNMGLNLSAELQVIKAVQAAQPHCLFILDANGNYTSKEAIMVLEKLHEMAVSPVLFEQPVHKDDWNGLADVRDVARDKYGINVAADESCQTLIDVQKVVQENIVDFINIKLAKFGVLGTLRVIEMARKSGLNLIIDSMVETRLATGFAGHLACGVGCFKYINLDAPFVLSEDPVFGGYEVFGPVYKFTNARGLGGFLKHDTIARKL
ncbi:Mandelate racemase/muconate lactonizing enzyme/methylaspartate ammonia-lyase [Trema orientale]|uniref:Mandelate racemase/muconate lactonizing enzyme/methylaspartate ammonia-lyase n=1 Tax=Trema orientale TaxID=63057 RepID=A0A2P5BKB6_TREOI|nr:Mandelate racemase/muconate lactonizing enzyme/methylaspartate ammonia-lyase [Trema orientale]